MPNWCEGWVKFRGSKENLMKFIQSEFNGSEPKFDGDELMPNIPDRDIFLNSLRRAFVDGNTDCDDYIYFNDNNVGIFVIKIKHAWCVEGHGYPELAAKYKLDIRGKCYECGMNFAEEFEYNSNGDEILYKVHKFDDYQWECECPTLGG
jgi:hypothetical protein